MAATAKRNPSEGRQSLAALEARDLRTIKASAVEELLSTAATAVASASKERFAMPPVWSTLRRTFHTLGEKERRICLLKLLLEESSRLDHDRSSRF